MLRAGLLATALAAPVGCELVTGITDKTLVAADASSGGIPCSKQEGFLLCDDFDASGETIGQSWDWHTSALGGTLALDSTDYDTPPRSAQFVGSAGAISSAQLGKDVGILKSQVRLAFDFRLDVDDPTRLPETSIAQVLTQGNALSVNYVVGPRQTCTLQVFDTTGSSAPIVTVPLAFPPVRKWTNIVLTADAQTLAVVEDGQMLGSTKTPKTGALGDTKFIVGVVYVNPSQGASAATLELDDVVLSGS